MAPECPYRVVIAEHLIDEVRFAPSPEHAATAAAEAHDLDALLEPVIASVAEVPRGERRNYVIRAVPVLRYEAEAEAPTRSRVADRRADEADGRRASVESDPLAASGRPGSDSPDGCR